MDENRKTVLRLDGSYGLGDLVAVTILTADKVHGKIETTYEVPYAIVDTKVLTSALNRSTFSVTNSSVTYQRAQRRSY